ncbi:MAG: SMI1/KNR4 family protein [Planctomycetia bacterium]|nr:SMI1/KNR4 family protein [Planctomycetia bacterium]
MHTATFKLLSLSGKPLGESLVGDGPLEFVQKWGTIGDELIEMARQRNGFYAFESALLVRPFQQGGRPLGLVEWNAADLWKGKYTEDMADVLFFAEDVFGAQFCIHDNKICTFDPESGLSEPMSSSIGAWASDLLADYEFLTGYPLAHTWQMKHGPLPMGVRLLPKTPFVCGGKYELENLYSLSDVEGMLFRSCLASSIHGLPDGSPIILEISPPERDADRQDSDDPSEGSCVSE